MRLVPASKGPFPVRPFYNDGEIEGLCAAELEGVGLLPERPEPVRIERFIEKRFGVTPDYHDLPDGVLGMTIFGNGGVREVVVSRSLSESSRKSADRQVRTTLAHEAGHGLCHTQLFCDHSRTSGELFKGADSQRRFMCRDIPVAQDDQNPRPKYDGRWWEYQANQAIPGLLLPKILVEVAMEPFLTRAGITRMPHLETSNRIEAISTISKTFDVNPVVARIRLENLYPIATQGQLTL